MTQTIVGTRASAPVAAPARVRSGRVLPLAVGGVIVLLPFGGISVPVVGMSVVDAAMAVPAALALRALARDEARLPSSLILSGLSLGLAACVVSAAVGVDPGDSVKLVVISLLTFGYGLAVAQAYRPGLEIDGLDLLVLVGGIVAAMALVSAGSLQAVDAGNVVTGRLTGPFSQPNELGQFCAALLPVAVACVVTSGSRRRTAALGLAAALLATACVLSMSRGSWIGALTGLAFLAVCEPATRRVLAAVGLAIVGTICAAMVLPTTTPLLGVLGSRIRTLGDPTQNQYDDRPLIWAEAWRQATEHPWLGVGPGGFPGVAARSASAVSADPPDHPHDLLLTVLAERGVIGVALGAVVVAGCLLATRAQLFAAPRPGSAPRALRARSLAVIAALAAVLAHGAFDMPLRNPIVSGLVWTLLGAAIVVESNRGEHPRW
ncbi:O-antigen ligase family protein [Nocardioides panacisoli]|uniref:O-antigen ligase-related domain-containing protein n=1 Tax=Nocardioides panacisoli TaxID=627624 RepID=A0ABP7IQ19_9ACTN